MIKKKNNKSKMLKTLAFLMLVGIFATIFSMSKIVIDDVSEYKEVVDTQEDIIDKVVVNDDDENEDFTIDWNRLKSINSDIVAWIRIPDSNISYPVVQGKTNSQYLRKNIYGNYSKGGTLFVDANIQNPFDDVNTIIYGHNLMSGAMFSSLKEYSANEYYQKHPFIYIYLSDNQIKKYEVVSFHIVNADNQNIYNPYVNDVEEYKNYMFSDNKINNNDIDIEKGDRVITLSTCTNRNKNTRYVLHAICCLSQ